VIGSRSLGRRCGNSAYVRGAAIAGTLTAISAGAVFMAANTYIGNTPNFMVKSICEERGINMPSFSGTCSGRVDSCCRSLLCYRFYSWRELPKRLAHA
jgi:hypothetical protein